MPHRVAVTGYGAVTPLGLNVEDSWNNLVAGTCGIGLITLFDTSDFDVKIAAEVRGFDPAAHIDPVTARYSDRFTQFALAAAFQAVAKAGLKVTEDNKYDIGIVIGSGIGGISSLSAQYRVLYEKGPKRISPFLIPMLIADGAPGQISIKLGIMGPNFSLASSCATGADALGMAFNLIRHGEISAMIAGGSDASITPIGIAGFTQAGALSKNPDPLKACRPFDKDRDGFITGEGAAVLVLENMNLALARGAQILAEITGYGATSDAYHITKPLESGEGAARAIETAFKSAGKPDLGYINAHGTSTHFNDLSETFAIKKVFGDRAVRIPISSTKSMHGHMLGATGAFEALVCCKIVQEGIIPPTINLCNPDPECDLDYVPNVARKADVRHAMTNSFGFGGHNSSLVISRYEGK
jgi:3-oxoacyl-[acyl-carrier-protein] synthase II